MTTLLQCTESDSHALGLMKEECCALTSLSVPEVRVQTDSLAVM